MHLIPGYRAVLDPFRLDIHVARYQRDRFVTQLDIKDTLEHEEEVIIQCMAKMAEDPRRWGAIDPN
jgi:hypothetical protein